MQPSCRSAHGHRLPTCDWSDTAHATALIACCASQNTQRVARARARWVRAGRRLRKRAEEGYAEAGSSRADRGAGRPGCYGSAANNINIFGVIAGAYADNSGNFVNHGLMRDLRDLRGKLTSFEAPGAGTGAYQGTGCPGCAFGLNASGVIAGSDTDANNVYHGLLRFP
jgi:hypothetical protein